MFALDRETGTLRWSKIFFARNDGPNGLAVADGHVYGATDSDAFALDASTGRELWSRHLTAPTEQFVDIAPVPWEGYVFVSTIGYPRGGRGAVYGLDAATGKVRWRFDTIKDPWRFPLEAGGGGLWYPVSIDGDGRLYGGNSNPSPWGGTPEHPNGGSYPGPVLYTDSLLVLDARSGRLLWHDQVTPHDIRDYDFEATPVLVEHDGRKLVIGAGKAGHVIAWDRDEQGRLWDVAVGLHLNDVGPLTRAKQTVCPGLLGGVETPLAYSDGRVFVPVVDVCVRGNSIGSLPVNEVDPLEGAGRLVALDASTGRGSGRGASPRSTSAARRPRTTSCSRPPTTARSTHSAQTTARSSGAGRCAPGSTAAPRLRATCCSSAQAYGSGALPCPSS